MNTSENFVEMLIWHNRIILVDLIIVDVHLHDIIMNLDRVCEKCLKKPERRERIKHTHEIMTPTGHIEDERQTSRFETIVV